MASRVARKNRVLQEMGDEGLEHAQQYSIFGDSNVCAALGAALDPNSGRFDPGLAFVIAAWPTLPETVRADIVAMVRAARDTG